MRWEVVDRKRGGGNLWTQHNKGLLISLISLSLHTNSKLFNSRHVQNCLMAQIRHLEALCLDMFIDDEISSFIPLFSHTQHQEPVHRLYAFPTSLSSQPNFIFNDPSLSRAYCPTPYLKTVQPSPPPPAVLSPIQLIFPVPSPPIPNSVNDT